MSEQEFANAGELEAWLESKGVPPRKAADAAATLFDKDFDCPSTLEGISSIQLEKNSLTTPLAQLLHNKLKPKQEEKHIFSHGLPEIGPQFSRFASKLSLPTEERHAAACLQVSKFAPLSDLGELPYPKTNIWNCLLSENGNLGGYFNEAGVNEFVLRVIDDVLEALGIRGKQGDNSCRSRIYEKPS